jgi:glycosyltransferase involved in cell wall biosynthesis
VSTGLKTTGRVALFIRSLKGNGAERSTANLAAALAGRGVEVDLVLVRAEGPFLKDVPTSVRIVDLKTRSGLPVLSLARSRFSDLMALTPVIGLNPPLSLGAIPALSAYLRETKPKALLSALDLCNVAAVIAGDISGTDTRIVLSQRNHPSVHHEAATDAKVSNRSPLFNRFYGRADAIVAVSDGVADDLAAYAGLPRSRIRTIYNAVYNDALVAAAAQEPDHPWFREPGGPMILAAGKLKQQKDFPTLLRAFAKVRAARPARLVILGEGPDREALLSLVAELGLQDSVSLPGFAQNPFAMMARANLFVLSSAFEGLPGVLIQALCCGCPVVATDCPSGPMEILEGGRHGALVRVGDSDAMASEIASALDAPPDRAALKARGAEFSGEKAADAYLSVMLGETS